MTNSNAYKRKDGRWEVRIYTGCNSTNKRQYHSFYGKTKQAAESKAAAFIKPEWNDPITELTVKELSEEYMTVKVMQLKESTVANYRMKLETHILPALGDYSVRDVKAQNIYAFMEKLRTKGLSERYIADNTVLLRSLLRYASVTYGVRNTAERLIMPKKAKPEVKLLSESEQERLKDYVERHETLSTIGIAVCLYTGIRIGELCALQWKDINLEKRTLTVRKTIQRIQTPDNAKRTKLVITEPKSQSSIRIIPIPGCLAEKLGSYVGKEEDYILSGSSKPFEPRTMQNRFARILKNANLPSVHFHSLRHAFATRCIALGFDVKTLSEILGHSSVELTLNRYVHSSMDRKKACTDKLTWAA